MNNWYKSNNAINLIREAQAIYNQKIGFRVDDKAIKKNLQPKIVKNINNNIIYDNIFYY